MNTMIFVVRRKLYYCPGRVISAGGGGGYGGWRVIAWRWGTPPRICNFFSPLDVLFPTLGHAERDSLSPHPRNSWHDFARVGILTCLTPTPENKTAWKIPHGRARGADFVLGIAWWEWGGGGGGVGVGGNSKNWTMHWFWLMLFHGIINLPKQLKAGNFLYNLYKLCYILLYIYRSQARHDLKHNLHKIWKQS